MDFTQIMASFATPVAAAIAYGAATLYKKTFPKAPKRFIPIGCAVVGMLIVLWAKGWALSPEIILTGIASGLAATGAHQAVTKPTSPE